MINPVNNFSSFIPNVINNISNNISKVAIPLIVLAGLPSTEGIGFGIIQNVIEGVVSFANFVYPHVTYQSCVDGCGMIYPELDWQYELCLRGCQAFRNQF